MIETKTLNLQILTFRVPYHLTAKEENHFFVTKIQLCIKKGLRIS